MYKKISILFVLLSCALIAQDNFDISIKYDKKEIQNKAIVKLIDSNLDLKKRVSRLEQQISNLSKNIADNIKMASTNTEAIPILGLSKPKKLESVIFYQPHRHQNVRMAPFGSAKLVFIAKNPEVFQIEEIYCKSDKRNGFWGKIKDDKGWLYIASTKYGQILDTDSKIMSIAYDKWCGSK